MNVTSNPTTLTVHPVWLYILIVAELAQSCDDVRVQMSGSALYKTLFVI